MCAARPVLPVALPDLALGRDPLVPGLGERDDHLAAVGLRAAADDHAVLLELVQQRGHRSRAQLGALGERAGGDLLVLGDQHQGADLGVARVAPAQPPLGAHQLAERGAQRGQLGDGHATASSATSAGSASVLALARRSTMARTIVGSSATRLMPEHPVVGVAERAGDARGRRGGEAADAGLQDDGQDRGADRAADALQDVELRRGVVDLVGAQDGVGGGHRRHHRHADAEAAHDHRRGDQDEARVGLDQDERDRRDDRDRAADQRGEAAAEALGDAAGEEHRDRGADALGSEQQAGVDGVLTADELEVERHQDHRAEQRRAERGHRHRRGGKGFVCVKAHVQQRILDLQGADDEGGDQRDAEQERDQHGVGQEAAGGAGLGQAVGDADEAGGDQREAGGVEAAGLLGRGDVAGEQAHARRSRRRCRSGG